ncbi:MAG TPA: VOC family protein [Flavobacterium sp.]|jgi:hypothetical protein
METQIFVNLPVKDLKRSMDFFTSLGYTFNMQFTDENAACLVISQHIYAMLLTEARFKDFTKKDIADASKTTEVILALSVESREKVDETVSKAIAAGGSAPNPVQDHGFMYGHGFEDPDGHLWEVFWFNTEAAPQQ